MWWTTTSAYPQREAVFALPKFPVPSVVKVTCPPVPDAGGCACGRERCAMNYGWDGMHPALHIGEADLMPDTQAEVYAICRKFGLTHLIYVGFHTQICLLGKSMGLKAMKSAGLRCVLARDMTDASPGYDPARNFTPDLNTEQVVEHFEKYLAPTISFQQELAKLGKWDAGWVVDPVRIAPWGTPMRPHLFEEPITVTLATPLQPGAEIRYTLDGSAPTLASTLYTKPLVFTDTTRLRAAAFSEGRAVCLESEAFFARMGPMPPLPDIFIGDLRPTRNVGFGHTYGGVVRYSGNTKPPQKDKSNLGQDLKINRRVYQHGMGVHAPCELMYAVEPEYTAFRRAGRGGREPGQHQQWLEPGEVSQRRFQGVHRRQASRRQPRHARPVAGVALRCGDSRGREDDQPGRDGCWRRFARGFRRLGQCGVCP